MSAPRVRELLARHGLAARRDLGQNFLVDERTAARLAEDAGVGPDDVVIEVGAGLGILTRALAATGARVIALEVDAGLVRALSAEALLPEGVELLHRDALRVDWPALVRERGATRVVGNLPYAISAPLLRRLLDLRGVLRDWSVMVQRDVAQRLLAGPGGRDYGSLGVLHRLCVDLARTRELGPGVFFPVPRVRSTFLRMVPRSDVATGSPAGPGPDELVRVETVLRAAFGQRRKTLANALRGAGLVGPGGEAPAGVCEALGIDPRARAETLPPEAFLRLARGLAVAPASRSGASGP